MYSDKIAVIFKNTVVESISEMREREKENRKRRYSMKGGTHIHFSSSERNEYILHTRKKEEAGKK